MTAMERLEWKDEYSVGEIDLDVHHRQLFEFLGVLADAPIDNEQSRAPLLRVLQDLVRYADYHFSAEEKYMEKIGYPQLRAHQAFHKEFTDSLGVFEKKFNKQALGLSQQLAVYLKNWLIKHILTEDRKYSNFCKEKCISDQHP